MENPTFKFPTRKGKENLKFNCPDEQILRFYISQTRGKFEFGFPLLLNIRLHQPRDDSKITFWAILRNIHLADHPDTLRVMQH